jgi:hypothetical protein
MSGFLKEKLVRVRNLLPSSVVVKEPVIEEEGWITLTLEIKER